MTKNPKAVFKYPFLFNGTQHFGMTCKEDYAVQALKSILARGEKNYRNAVQDSVEVANLLIEALENDQKEQANEG